MLKQTQKSQLLKMRDMQTTLTAGGMVVMPEEDFYGVDGSAKKHNNDLIMGQHQVVKISGNRQTPTTTVIYDNRFNNQYKNEHDQSSATINDQQSYSQKQQAVKTKIGSLYDKNNVITEQNSLQRDPLGNVD